LDVQASFAFILISIITITIIAIISPAKWALNKREKHQHIYVLIDNQIKAVSLTLLAGRIINNELIHSLIVVVGLST